MFILEFIGRFLTLNEFAVLAMFLTFIFMLFRGIPVAFSWWVSVLSSRSSPKSFLIRSGAVSAA